MELQSEEKSLKSKIAEREEQILAFWKENKIFEKTLKKDVKNSFTFFDGPPFANGLPHYGHMLTSFIKDSIPRYMTMKGYKVDRKWGWDCHGLPVENEVEKEFGLKTKKDIEIFGIEKFNEEARCNVMKYADKWREIIPRIGRWVDMDNDYRTMDSTFTESVWWAFGELYKKNLLYQGFKSMQICPRCETTLSNFEVTQGYKEITDISVYVKFKVRSGQKVAGQNVLDKDKVFLLAWTTTPWTLPGNTALAINPESDYVLVSAKGETYILAKELEEKVLKDKNVEKTLDNVLIKGSELVGLLYEPPFDYFFNDKKIKNHVNGWKVYGASFVTMQDGTGIVHIAPAFGDDDLGLAQKENLPIVQHVEINGTIKKEVVELAGLQAKPKEDSQKTDVEVIKILASKGVLFAKDKIKHSYPHCWRCDTPLLNYATTSWFVKVSDFKDKLVKENKNIDWVPSDIKEGRFGKWLEGARDWAISRSRFWGAPIPVWICKGCGEKRVISSVSQIEGKPSNNYFLIRHGEAENNVLSVNSSALDSKHKLTPKGIEQVKKSAEILKKKSIDLIFYSPLRRTHETGEILRDLLSVSPENFIVDDRLREEGAGKYEGQKVVETRQVSPHKRLSRFTEKKDDGVETYNEIKERTGSLFASLEKKYKGKNILIVSHDTPIWLMKSLSLGLDNKQTLEIRGEEMDFVKNAEILEIQYKHLPRNKNFDLDLHRPFIDDFSLKCNCGGKMERVPEVFDCWFESGSMPFASNHYPYGDIKKFDPRGNLLKKPVGYPAKFIAEGLDQTRGWFYSMIVLGTSLFGRSPYENVLVSGTVLAENGEKMSKRLKNYPDPMFVVNKYGADSLRYYLLSSPVVHAEDLKFSEKGVDEVSKKVISRLDNVLSFYKLYQGEVSDGHIVKSNNILDLWILKRLSETIKNIGQSLEKYELDRASRPIMAFIEDLSVWYLRRSRDRFKSDNKKDKDYALNTTRIVLLEFSKSLAPFLPFYSEFLYKEVGGKLESVHLESWPNFKVNTEEGLIENMEKARKFSSIALEKRARANIKIRQPLSKITLKDKKFSDERFLSIIKDEVNIKDIVFNEKLDAELVLDTEITAELKEEGIVRDVVRAIQEARKNNLLTIKDLASITIDCEQSLKDIIERNKEKIAKLTLAFEIKFGTLSDATPIETDIGVLKMVFAKK